MTMRSQPRFSVTRGAYRRPMATIITGRSGIGKTYFASTIPGRFFIPVEEGLHGASPDEIDGMARFDTPRSLGELMAMLAEFASFARAEGYKHLVVDSLTAIERLVHLEACGKESVAHMEAKAYKVVWAAATPLWQRIRDALDAVRDEGVNVWVIAHSQETREGVDTGETFIKMDLQFSGSGNSVGEVRNAWKAWADNVLFIDWAATVKQGKSMGQKAVGQYKSRIIWTREQPARYAKVRFACSETIPASFPDFERAMRSGMAQSREKAVRRVQTIIATVQDADDRQMLTAALGDARTSDALAAVLSRAEGVLTIEAMNEEDPAEAEDSSLISPREEAPAVVPTQSPDLVKAIESCMRSFPDREAEIFAIANNAIRSDATKVNDLRFWFASARDAKTPAPAPAPAPVAPPQPREQTTHEKRLVGFAERHIKAIRQFQPESVAELDGILADYAAGPNGLRDLSEPDLDPLVTALENILNGVKK